MTTSSEKVESFQKIIKKAYERGTTENEITVDKLLEDIMNDLKNIISK